MSKKKKKKQNSKLEFLHHVDDKHEIVYYNVRSFLGNLGARARLKTLFPDYEYRVASQDLIEYLNGED